MSSRLVPLIFVMKRFAFVFMCLYAGQIYYSDENPERATPDSQFLTAQAEYPVEGQVKVTQNNKSLLSLWLVCLCVMNLVYLFAVKPFTTESGLQMTEVLNEVFLYSAVLLLQCFG